MILIFGFLMGLVLAFGSYCLLWLWLHDGNQTAVLIYQTVFGFISAGYLCLLMISPLVTRIRQFHMSTARKPQPAFGSRIVSMALLLASCFLIAYYGHNYWFPVLALTTTFYRWAYFRHLAKIQLSPLEEYQYAFQDLLARM